jgi:microcystin-dependent protein
MINNTIKTLLIILAISYVLNKILPTKEGFQTTTTSTGYSNLVLADSTGNMNSIAFPKGIIVLWNGEPSQIPSGWSLCNGTNGTPDLRGRFVIGVNPNNNKSSDTSLTIKEWKSQGGSETHILSIDEMPTHTHTITGKGNDDGYCKTQPCGFWGTDQLTNDGPSISSSNNPLLQVSNSGLNKPHNNMPPYYALAYIMKL